MNIKIAGGIEESGIAIGNTYDKYSASNPIVKWIMKGFEGTLSEFVAKASPESIHEIGCGEGYWVLRWNDQGLSSRGSDFSISVIEIARTNAESCGFPPSIFKVASIYDLDTAKDTADLIVCCEVIEHLEHPEAGLKALQRVARKYLILSVPQEPLWCALNLARGKYIRRLGNTPGHIQHWTRKGFFELVSQYFDVIEARSPLPWTMLLCHPHH